MKIIFCHHAERKVKKKLSQEDGLTKHGKIDAKNTGKILAKHQKVKEIYTSTHFRCKETAKILNKFFNVPITEDERFNEFTNDKQETWTGLQNRIIEALNDIVAKHDDQDTVVCVTSGVNIAGFIDFQLGLKPSEEAPFLGIISCSPIIFTYKKQNNKSADIIV